MAQGSQTSVMMADAPTIPNVVSRGQIEGSLRAAARQQRTGAVLAGRAMLWTALLAIGVVTVIPVARFAGLEMETWTLLQSDDASVRSELARLETDTATMDYLEALMELGVQPATENLDAAYVAASRATEADPSRAHAWAQLAYLEFRKGGKVTAAGLDALLRSMDACPVCDQSLVRWRFNFVLANWSAVPDELRHRAFEHADILRWIGQNREFLAEMRVKAVGAGIPFDEYRAAVDTPVRNWELEQSPQALATPMLRPRT
jgi:hypothetical protein